MQIKLLVACADEHAARALCTRLTWTDGCLLGEGAALPRLLESVTAVDPDVLLLEYLEAQHVAMFEALAGVRRCNAHTRILLLADAPPHTALPVFIRRGVSGCVLRASPPALQAKAVRAVHQGETWFARAELLAALRSQLRVPAPLGDADADTLLTTREREILALIGDAMSNKEIARHLNISDHTVKTHLHHIYVKLHRSGRYKALLTEGPVPPDWVRPVLLAGRAGVASRS
jgi:DNA-binding NarL/FixJ family response regulator